MLQHTVPISVRDLRVGVICSHPVEGAGGILLLGANTRITQQVIAGLRDRGIDYIEVDPRDASALGGGKTKPRRAGTKRPTGPPGQWNLSKPAKEFLVDRHSEGLSEERAARLHVALEHANQSMEQLQANVRHGVIHSIDELSGISDGFARSMLDDHDQTVSAISRPLRVFERDEHSVRMSAMGMAIAIEMGLDGIQILEVGTAGLLHDVGLFAMDEKFLDHSRPWSASDWWEYKKHPNISVDCIADAIDVSESVQLTVQQVHEQFDGSGYPRGLKAHRIHQHARILNVADAYLRLTSAAFDRSPVVPHDALGLILHLAGRGLFDPQVIRAFLRVETLFPLGSMVELSSGQQAQVIRRPQTGFASPVLISSEGARIELESANLQIIRPLCDLEIGQVRLTREGMLAAKWHPAGPESLI